jgi:hypothetical protein
MLASRASGYGLSAAQIRDVNQRVVKRGVDVGDTPPLNCLFLRHFSGPRKSLKEGNTFFAIFNLLHAQ